jgi:hypothetical protein
MPARMIASKRRSNSGADGIKLPPPASRVAAAFTQLAHAIYTQNETTTRSRAAPPAPTQRCPRAIATALTRVAALFRQTRCLNVGKNRSHRTWRCVAEGSRSTNAKHSPKWNFGARCTRWGFVTECTNDRCRRSAGQPTSCFVGRGLQPSSMGVLALFRQSWASGLSHKRRDWTEKIERNRHRDRDTNARLADAVGA